jgi:hypothetical protein
MKYIVILATLLISSCQQSIKIAENYNKQIVAGKIIEYQKSETNETFFYEFKSQVSDREINEVFVDINKFKENYKLIGKFETASYTTKHKELFKKDIEEVSKEIGAKYTLAYKLHKVYGISDYSNRAIARTTSDETTIYYLILFFTDKDE